MMLYFQALNALVGNLYQLPPVICAVKRQLRLRTVYDAKLLDYDDEKNLGEVPLSLKLCTYCS